MTDVMISYSRRDGDFVRRLHAGLENRGREVWVDWQDIPLSADWWQEIATAIEAADTFVFVVSPDSMGSPICNLEIDHARRNNKRLIPILHRRTDLDDALDVLGERELSENTEKILNGRTIEEIARHNWNSVARHNWLYFEDLTNFEDGLDRLISVIELDLEHVKEHTRLLVRASEWDRRDRSSSFLLTGEEIGEAESWLTHGMSKEPNPTALHADYIGASRRAAESRQRRILVGVSVALVFAIILMIVSVVLAFFAQNQQQIAVAARSEAEVQAEIAATSAAEANSLLWASYAAQTIEEGDSPLALSLALASVSLEDPPALAHATLASVAFAPGPIARFAPGEDSEITAIRFSPDEQQAAIALADGQVVIYDLETEAILHTLDDFNAAVTSIVYASDGSLLLAASFNTATLFDTESMQPIQTLEHPLGSIVTSVELHPNGTEAVTGLNTSQIIHWDLTTGDILRELDEHDGQITGLDMNRNGDQMVSGSVDNQLILWDMESGEMLDAYDHNSSVTSVAFNPIGGTAAVGTQLGNLQIRNLDTGDIIATPGDASARHDTRPIVSLTYSQDGRLLMSGGEDSIAIVWSAFTGDPLQVFDAHDSAVTGVDIGQGNRTVLTGSQDGTMFWWSISDDSVQHTFITNGHAEEIETLAYANDGQQLVTTDLNGVLLLWDTATESVTQRYNIDGDIYEGQIHALDFLPDGDAFVSGGEDATIRVWRTDENAAPQMTLSGPHADEITMVAVSPDGSQLLSGDGSGMLVAWDLTTGEPSAVWSDGESETGHSRDIMGIKYNSEGSLALSGSADRTMILWDTATGEVQHTYEHGGRILGVGFSPDERRVYSGSNDDTIRVWNIETAEQVGSVNIGQDGQERFTSAVRFHQGNNFALTGHIDGSVVLWNMGTQRAISQYQENLSESTNQPNQITALDFQGDGQLAGVGARNRAVFTVRTFPLPTLIDWTRANRYVPELSCEERQIHNIPCEGESLAETSVTPEPATQ